MFRQYLVIALRIMWRNKIFTLINLLSLSIGIMFCLLIFTFIKNETSHDTFHPNRNRIFRVINHYTGTEEATEKSALNDHKFVQIFSESIPSLVRATAFQKTGAWIRRDDKIFHEDIAFVDSTFLELFHFPLLAGNPKTALLDPQSAIITREVADKFFDTKDGDYQKLLGKFLTFPKGDERNFIVTGILESIPRTSSLQFTILTPYKNNIPYPESNDFFGNCSIYIELASTQDRNQATEAANSLVETHLSDKFEMARKYIFGEDKDLFFEFILQPLTDIYLNDEVFNQYERHGNIKYAYVLFSIAVLVLIISCINYIMLTTGQVIQRLKEVGMRKVLGAGTPQIIHQFIAEAFLSSILSLMLAIALANLFLPVFNQLSQRELTIFLFDPTMTLFILILVFIITVIIGIAPGISFKKMNPQDILQSRIHPKGSSRYSSFFVISQYTIAIILIISTFIILKQLHFLRGKDTGFNTKDVVVISLPDDFSNAQINRLKQTLVTHSNINGVTGSDRNFIAGSSSSVIKRADEQTITTRYLRIDPDYTKTLGIPLMLGRNLSWEVPADTFNSVLVNQKFVREMQWEDPIGMKVPEDLDDEKNPVVVGVVQDFHFDSMEDEIMPLILHMNPNRNSLWSLFVRINPYDVGGSLENIQTAWTAVAPDRPLNYTFLDESLDSQYQSEERWSKIVGYGAGFSILIASLGLLGLTLLIVTRRTKEIGIRKVNGASYLDILMLIFRAFATWILIGLILATPISLYTMQRWLQNFAYKTVISGWTFIAAGVIALLVALLTVGWHTYRAATKNPVEALRYE
jgi:putative ABC transport system permease protein